LPGSSKHETLNPKQSELAEAVLKKQSQFPDARISVNVLQGKDYGNMARFPGRENKACAKVSWCNSAGLNPARPKLADRLE